LDKKTFNILKHAVRVAWQRSTRYKELINEANYTCANCNTKVTNKANLYLEHITPIKLLNYYSIEDYDDLMRDEDNLAVWCKACKPAKDKADAKLRKKK
jgi:5-methylcytosine-specific restriction endonuclease McrA